MHDVRYRRNTFIGMFPVRIDATAIIAATCHFTTNIPAVDENRGRTVTAYVVRRFRRAHFPFLPAGLGAGLGKCAQ